MADSTTKPMKAKQQPSADGVSHVSAATQFNLLNKYQDKNYHLGICSPIPQIIVENSKNHKLICMQKYSVQVWGGATIDHCLNIFHAKTRENKITVKFISVREFSFLKTPLVFRKERYFF